MSLQERLGDALERVGAEIKGLRDDAVTSATVEKIWAGSQAQYDAVTPKDPGTLYVITEGGGAGSPGQGEEVWRINLTDPAVGQLWSTPTNQMLGETHAVSMGFNANGEIVQDGGEKLFRNKIPANDLGNLIASPKLPSMTHCRVSFDVRFDPNFDWRWGGKVGAGLVGIKPGADIYAPTSGQSRDNGWSARFMWHGRGDDQSRPFGGTLGPIPEGQNSEVVTYIYAIAPNEGFDGFGYHAPVGEFLTDVWHTCSIEVELNTPGVADGRLVYKMDDVTWQHNAVNFRATSDITTTAVLYDTHRGGGLSGSWPSSRACYLDVRNAFVENLGA